MSFSGFSEEDIRKANIKSQDNSSNKNNKGRDKVTKKVTFKPHPTTNNSKTKKLQSNNVAHYVEAQELPESAKLTFDKSLGDGKLEPNIQQTKLDESKNEVKVAVQRRPDQKNAIDLDEFEARQKLIEEQNRKRKELLAKALADRTKRTQEEAQRLGEIQEEFKKLDAVLSSDVKILRKEIDFASFEYTECQKKYDRIEKDFLAAKLQLHQKKEKKQMLTEHLCAIIEKNEERKADKLNELLLKLESGGRSNVKSNTSSGDPLGNGQTVNNDINENVK